MYGELLFWQQITRAVFRGCFSCFTPETGNGLDCIPHQPQTVGLLRTAMQLQPRKMARIPGLAWTAVRQSEFSRRRQIPLGFVGHRGPVPLDNRFFKHRPPHSL